jgi:hypothetical protein
MSFQNHTPILPAIKRIEMSERIAGDWADSLNIEELYQLATNPERILVDRTDINTHSHLAWVMREMHQFSTIDELGTELMPRAIDGDAMYAFWPDYWEKLKHEFKLLICTVDERYAELRAKLTASANKTQTGVVSSIAAAMAAQFGVIAGLLVPFVALCLIVLARVGKEAFCSTMEWTTPLKASES